MPGNILEVTPRGPEQDLRLDGMSVHEDYRVVYIILHLRIQAHFNSHFGQHVVCIFLGLAAHCPPVARMNRRPDRFAAGDRSIRDNPGAGCFLRISASMPAISTPVGPPPTITTVASLFFIVLSGQWLPPPFFEACNFVFLSHRPPSSWVMRRRGCFPCQNNWSRCRWRERDNRRTTPPVDRSTLLSSGTTCCSLPSRKRMFLLPWNNFRNGYAILDTSRKPVAT